VRLFTVDRGPEFKWDGHIFLSSTIADQVKQEEQNHKIELLQLEEVTSLNISAIDKKFPLKISEVNFDGKDDIIQLNDGTISKIEQTIKNYYATDCLKDSLQTCRDTYINTIRLHDSLQTIYLVLLKHYPTEVVNSKVLFYDNQQKEFTVKPFDFNLYALYEFDNGKLKPTNLKTDFKVTTPEIELVDFNKDGLNDYKFTRLFHNGTFNSIQTTILTIKNTKIDTLYFNERGLDKWARK
jgi:hypothetical protein